MELFACVFHQVRQKRLVGAAEILIVPPVNGREHQPRPIKVRSAFAVDVLPGALFKELLNVVLIVGRWLEVGTSHAGAVKGVMDARVFKYRPQNAVLDIV